jgi:hypothetical protein
MQTGANADSRHWLALNRRHDLFNGDSGRIRSDLENQGLSLSRISPFQTGNP